MPFQPGNKLGGRPKGSRNKFTCLKDDFLAAYHKTGGVKGLCEWIEKDPKNREVFYKMLARMLPSEVAVRDTVTSALPPFDVIFTVPVYSPSVASR